jgi:hypothetical protein
LRCRADIGVDCSEQTPFVDDALQEPELASLVERCGEIALIRQPVPARLIENQVSGFWARSHLHFTPWSWSKIDALAAQLRTAEVVDTPDERAQASGNLDRASYPWNFFR